MHKQLHHVSDWVLMREKRKIERFDLQIETVLNVQENGWTAKKTTLLTRDISSAGVFLTTDSPLPVGTKINLNFLLSPQGVSGISKDQKVNIKTSGKVIRTDEEGMAVAFEKLYKVTQLK